MLYFCEFGCGVLMSTSAFLRDVHTLSASIHSVHVQKICTVLNVEYMHVHVHGKSICLLHLKMRDLSGSPDSGSPHISND